MYGVKVPPPNNRDENQFSFTHLQTKSGLSGVHFKTTVFFPECPTPAPDTDWKFLGAWLFFLRLEGKSINFARDGGEEQVKKGAAHIVNPIMPTQAIVNYMMCIFGILD